MSIKGFLVKHWRLIVALIFGPLISFTLMHGFMWVIYDFDPNFMAIDTCLDGGGVWLDHWEQCDPDGSLQKEYCQSLSPEDYKEFRCDAR